MKKFVDPKTGEEVSEEDSDRASEEFLALAEKIQNEKNDRVAKRDELISRVAEKLGLSKDEAKTLFR